jgi:tRNA pseudouridine32 synthase/23S rRNA pseudouridine746 synthase
MSISKYPSLLSLPQINPGVSSVLEYLIVKFPNISQNIWQQRMREGKVHWHDGSLISVDTPFRSQQRVYYYREVETEPVIPFEEEILFQDEHILVAHKPHFLPVIPGGKYIDECLQNRLRKKTGIENLQALHRLDRPTAGLVLFSTNIESRHRYHQLFEENKIHKIYLAIATTTAATNSEEKLVGKLIGKRWQVKNRITRVTNGESRFLMEVVSGLPNSHSEIRCLKQTIGKALFELNPITGKTHQLRLHMQTIGWPILNDRYYPTLQPETADDYSQPLQLLAKELQFVDPVTNVSRTFISNAHLRFE